MRIIILMVVAAGVTFGIVRGVAEIAVRLTGVPRDFPPFTTLPLLSGVIGGFLGASLVYSVVSTMSKHPNRHFFFISIAILALSFGLPLRLSFTKSHRFDGVTPAAQMTLAMLHTIIATSVFSVLTRNANLPK